MRDLLSVCSAKGYVKPSIYQGQYNALFRSCEKYLFPLLREHNIKFYAYSPLAGGFLTGKLTLPEMASSAASPAAESNPSVTASLSSRNRYTGPNAAPFWNNVFNRPPVHRALKHLSETLQSLPEAKGMSLAEVSLRWLVYHSALGNEDGVILGASRVEQVAENVRCCRAGPLSEDIRKAVEGLWEDSRKDRFGERVNL